MMKKFTATIAIVLVVCLLTETISGISELENMTDKLIRLHVVANSDSDYDQSLKLKVRDAVLECVSDLTQEAGADSKEEAEKVIMENYELIEAAASNTLRNSGCNLPVTVGYEKTLIDTRVYDDFTLPYGMYDTLCVRIGSASGKNWWCVLFPALCVSGAVSIEESGVFDDGEIAIMKEPQKVKYRLFLFELFERVKCRLSGAKRLCLASAVFDLDGYLL